MEVIFHFLFQILKNVVLGILYGSLIFSTITILGKIEPKNFFGKLIKTKRKIWLTAIFWSTVFLFIFTFTHYGNHGFGDKARIPLNKHKEVIEINNTDVFIKPSNIQHSLSIIKFTSTKNYLVGHADSNHSKTTMPYFAWSLLDNSITFFKTAQEYKLFAKENSLPKISDFKSFNENYKDYWGGSRFFLLP